MRNTNLFRGLTGYEEEAVTLMDNRDVFNKSIPHSLPNNKLLITCDHASNDVKFFKLSLEEEDLYLSNEYFDAGTADITSTLSE